MDRRDFLSGATASLAFSASSSPEWLQVQDRLPVLTTQKSWDPSSVKTYEGNFPDIYSYIDSHKDAHIRNIQKLLRQPSVSAQNYGISECAQMVAETLKELGCQEVRVVPTKGHPVVWGWYDAGAPRTLLNYGMYDVQPVNPEEWISPPFEANIIEKPPFGKTIIARGAINTKGPLRAYLNALESIIKVREKLPVNMMFAIEGEEEIGSVNYHHFIEEHKDRLSKADGVLFAMCGQDTEGKISMALGVKGICYIEVEASGGRWGLGPAKGDIHSSYKAVVDSPVWRLLHALASMVDRSGNRIIIDGYHRDIAPPSEEDQQLINTLLKTFDDNVWKKDLGVKTWTDNVDKQHLILRYLYNTTMNIAGIWGGYSGPGPKTILPMKATAKIDSRLVPNQTPEKALERIRTHLSQKGFGDVDVRFLEGYPPSKTSVNTPPVESALGVYKKYNVSPIVWPHLAGSAPFFVFTDILKKPFVIMGIGHGSRAHSNDEYLVIEGKGIVADLMDAEKAYVDMIFAFAG